MTPQVGGTIDSAFLQRYDATVQSALSSGPNVHVIIDLVSANRPLYILPTFSSSIHSTTTLAGTVLSSPKAALPTTNSPASGRNSLRSTVLMSV